MLLQSFPNGILHLPTEFSALTDASLPWIQQPVNGALIIVEAVIILFFLQDILFILPPVMTCFQRWQSALSIEHNIPWARTRDKVALVLYPIYVLFIQWSGIWDKPLLWIFCVLLIYSFVRKAFYRALPHKRIKEEVWQACRNTPTIFSIPLAFVWVGSMIVMLVLEVVPQASKVVLVSEAACFLVISTLRQLEILAFREGAFRSFLYLCALEIAPLLGLVCVIVFL